MCGGTEERLAADAVDHGLSPRVRGNPPDAGMMGAVPRSIPACAGEPWPSWCRYAMPSVYPRVCGGTEPPPTPDEAEAGLSPRVRGNRSTRGSTCCGHRSIPACAGEPLMTYAPEAGDRVYPRVCGGTPWRIDTLYFISFASGTGLTVSYQVHTVSVYNFLGRFSQTSDALLSRRRRISPSHHD